MPTRVTHARVPPSSASWASPRLSARGGSSASARTPGRPRGVAPLAAADALAERVARGIRTQEGNFGRRALHRRRRVVPLRRRGRNGGERLRERGVRRALQRFRQRRALPRDRLAPLAPELASTPPLAHLCVLSHVAFGASGRATEHASAAEALFASLVSGGVAMDARIDRKTPGAGCAVGPGRGARVARHARRRLRGRTRGCRQGGCRQGGCRQGGCRHGGCRPGSRGRIGQRRDGRRGSRARRSTLGEGSSAKNLLDAMERARRERRGMWEYGDVDSDDEEEERPKAPGAWGRRR